MVAHIAREMEHDRMDIAKGKALTYVVSVLVNIIRDSSLEERLAQLEAAHLGRKK